MTELLDLANMESSESELIPEILPIDSRLSIEGSAQKLAELFASANAVAPTKAILPNTDYVLLEAFEATALSVAHIQASATDGERAITKMDDSFLVRMAGSALVPGRRIAEILKLVPNDTVRIDVVGDRASIKSGPAVWKVATPPADSTLPTFVDIDSMEFFSVDASDLRGAMDLVFPAVSKTTARHSLMQAEIAKGIMTACDGVRAHKVTVPGLDKSFKTTIPLAFMATAMKELLRFDGGVAEIGTDHSAVVLKFGKDIIRSQRLNYTFPAVDHLVLAPAIQNQENWTVNIDDLAGVVRRVRVNADPDFTSVTISLRQLKGQWTTTVHARDKKGNSSQETILCGYDGPDAAKDFTVNHKQFLEFLACLDETEVTFKLGEQSKQKQTPIYVSSGEFVGSLMVVAPSFIK